MSIRKILAVACVSAGVLLSNISCASSENVVTSASNGKSYHHLKLSLNDQSISSIKEFSADQFVMNGGQFEVRVLQNSFPIKAPNCKGDLILRMPWTNSDLSAAEVFIDEKYNVYKAIVGASKSEGSNVDVYLELNPYVQMTGDDFELTECNVFFRHANGQYIPKTGTLN
ncbi:MULTISPECIES: hypothetical protein [unclassified Agarivorans]|uniref:hypothetical protein n=1 Tax=unclassified Agarivorans TaxID=2636026 RepID=UPI0026E381DD|nr:MULTISPECIES: hypothetical protein [unclassified Agarivorans]MDO6685273.1 hypothetical protein [Agarivorans sp. 3_MG-2023]MDO6715555.1 hypothetical protein [Agarivorans sp. 2_MG-2023]